MRKDYVLGFAFTQDRSKVVLMLKNRPAWQAGKFNGIGGKIEPGEDGSTAMCREFLEETGIETIPAQWHHYTKIIGRDGDVWVYRLFDDCALKALTCSDEPVVIMDLDFDLIRTKALSNVLWLIGIALDEAQPIFFVEANYNQEFITGKTGTN